MKVVKGGRVKKKIFLKIIIIFLLSYTMSVLISQVYKIVSKKIELSNIKSESESQLIKNEKLREELENGSTEYKIVRANELGFVNPNRRVFELK